MEAAKDYRKGAKIFLQGIGTRNRQGKLVKIDSIESSTVLEPLDIQARLEELRHLKPDWFEAGGEPFDPDGIAWLESSVRDHYGSGMPLPHIFPVPGGQVLFEWKLDTKAASLEIDLGGRTGYWHVLDLKMKDDSDEDMDLGAPEGWNRLTERLMAIGGSEAK